MVALVQALGGWLRRMSDRPAVLLFFAVIFLLSQISIYAVLEPVGLATVWKLQTTLSVDEFSALLADMYSRDAAEPYLAHFYYDFLHPFWYSVLLALLIGRGMNRHEWPAGRDALVVLPLLAGLLDQVQNSLHLYMVVDTANVAAPLVLVANGAGLLKLGVVAASVLALGLVWLARPVRRAG